VFRLAQPDLKQGYDVIIVARGRAVGAETRKLRDNFYQLCRQLDLLEERK
jgi:RNase P protein component